MDTTHVVNKLKPFEHTWVARVDDEVIASGESVAEVKRQAEQAGVKHVVFSLVPSSAASLAPATPWH